MVKEMISGIAKKVLPMPLRNVVRPYWDRLMRIEEIKRLGPAARWPSITKDEVPFWYSLLDENNHDPNLWWGPETRAIWTNPEMLLEDYLTALIKTPEPRVKILDVGAGPLTSLGKKWPGHNIEITAIDANAPEYDLLLQKLGINPLVRTTYGIAEELSFPSSSFHLVHAQNSIDHCRDPIKVILEMVRVVRPGCCVYLDHRIREGRVEKYMTNHQWDLFPKRGRFYVERPGMKATDVGPLIGECATVSVGPSRNGRDWFSVTIRRH